MRSKSILVLVIVVLLFGFESLGFANTPSFQGIGILSGGFPSAVSDDGLIVTGYGGPITEAFLWTADVGIVSLGLPGYSMAQDISGNGLIVVGDCNPGTGTEAFRWCKSDGMTGLGILPGGTFSVANGTSHDGSVIVGHSTSSLGVQAFRWTQSEGMSGIGDLAGGDFYSTANNISYDGSVIVGLSKSNLGREAFYWTEATGMIGLGDFDGGGFSSIACAVSGDGSVIVGRSNGINGDEAFYWTAEDGMINLKDMLENTYGMDLTNWALNNAIALSGNGNIIVGYGINPDGNQEGWIASIPEPTIEAALDIKPQSCPNLLNVHSYGVLPAAILGSEEFDVNAIDAVSVRLNGIAPIRHNYEDVTAPVVGGNECECTTAGPDGHLDLTLKFDKQEIIDTLGDVNGGDVLTLTVEGVLTDETPIEGSDCVKIIGIHKPHNRADINKDGKVDLTDFAIFSENWLQSSIVY